MHEIVLISNLIFLIIMIAFAIKVRADIENIKKKENKNEKQNEIQQNIETLKMHIAGLEERLISLEYDSKEIHEKIGQLTKDIQDIKQVLKEIEMMRYKKEDGKEEKAKKEGEKEKKGWTEERKEEKKGWGGEIDRGREIDREREIDRGREIDREREIDEKIKIGNVRNSEGRIQDAKERGKEIEKEREKEIEKERDDNVQKLVVSLLRGGKSPEEVSKLLGLSYEEVKLIYMMKKSE